MKTDKEFKHFAPRFIIAANGRSGSYFLMDLLMSTKKVGIIGEFLGSIIRDGYKQHRSDSLLLSSFKVMHEIATSVPNPRGLWGTKVDMNQLYVMKRFLELCNLEPKDIKWIWLSRKNKLLQAISFFRADATGIWHLKQKDEEETRSHARSEINVTTGDIFQRAGRLHLYDLLWDSFFAENEITPHKVYYEDFIDATTWDSTIAGIFDYLDVDYSLPLNVATNRIKIGTDDHHKIWKAIIEDLKQQDIPVKKLIG